jgi:hypothetical protein
MKSRASGQSIPYLSYSISSVLLVVGGSCFDSSLGFKGIQARKAQDLLL